MSEIFFGLFLPGVLALVLSPTNPVHILTFIIIYFRWREGVPTSVLGSQPIVWLLPSSFRYQATRVRLPSTNICWSPRDPHSFLTVILWWLATVNSNTGNSINLISIVSVGYHVTLVISRKCDGVLVSLTIYENSLTPIIFQLIFLFHKWTPKIETRSLICSYAVTLYSFSWQ